jgi:MSHA biogenesis protein MshQ
VECGDGLIVDIETCDDGNTFSGDGCGPTCQTEVGWQCTGEPSVCTPIATGWYDTDWDYRKQITIDASHVTSDLTEFPVLVYLASDSDLAANARGDAFDILFTAADGTTKLSHEIQDFDGGTGELVAWVKVPLLSSTVNTNLFMYFGNSGSGDQQDVANVWSNGYEAVLHLQEAGAGQAFEYLDSSGNGHHGTGGGLAGGGDPNGTPGRTAGLFGFAQDFDDGGVADLIRLDAVDDQAWTEVTVQAWINTDDNGDDRIFAKTWSTNPTDIVWQLGKTSVNKVRLRTDVEPINSEGGTAFTHGTWTHLVMTWTAGNPGAVTVYRNGQSDLTAPISGVDLYDSYPIPAPTIGNVPGGDRGFDGQLQEVRLSFVARSSQWLETEFINQFSPSTFYSVGTLEASP